MSPDDTPLHIRLPVDPTDVNWSLKAVLEWVRAKRLKTLGGGGEALLVGRKFEYRIGMSLI